MLLHSLSPALRWLLVGGWRVCLVICFYLVFLLLVDGGLQPNSFNHLAMASYLFVKSVLFFKLKERKFVTKIVS